MIPECYNWSRLNKKLKHKNECSLFEQSTQSHSMTRISIRMYCFEGRLSRKLEEFFYITCITKDINSSMAP